MAEYYFGEFESYLRSLCIQHKEVLHDDVGNRAFVRFQSGEDIESIPNNASSVVVVFEQFVGRAIGSIDENKLQQHASILFLVHVSVVDGNVYEAKQAAQKKAMDIMFQFYARMIHDFITDDCGPLRNLVPEQMNFYSIDGPVIENHFGWGMDIPFNAQAPAYNLDKWNIP